MASVIDISAALKRLTDTLPPPRGVSMDKAFDGYVDALKGFAVEDIEQAIVRYFAAEFPDVSTKFYPRAPELANIVRMVQAKKARVGKLKVGAAPLGPVAKTLFQRQFERFKAGEIKSLGDGIHGVPDRSTPKPDPVIRERYGMTEEALAGLKNAPPPIKDDFFGGLP